jgi:hypothetical protein
MADNENMESALYAIHSRLGVIEGKVNLVARAEREHLLGLIEERVREDALTGQIYLLLDGRRTQREVLEQLGALGIQSSQPSVSRRMTKMETEEGIIVHVGTGGASIYAHDPAMEKVLNLSANVRKWLAEEGATVPDKAKRPRRRA